MFQTFRDGHTLATFTVYSFNFTVAKFDIFLKNDRTYTVKSFNGVLWQICYDAWLVIGSPYMIRFLQVLLLQG